MAIEPPEGKKPSQQHQGMSGEIPEHMRKSPPELVTGENCATVSQPEMETKLSSSQADFNTISWNRSHLTEPSKYDGDSKHHWLFILLKITSTIDLDTLQNVPLHSCFAIVDKESKLTDPWRRGIIRKVHKATWEVLDKFGESVLETMGNHSDKGIIGTHGTHTQVLVTTTRHC